MEKSEKSIYEFYQSPYTYIYVLVLSFWLFAFSYASYMDRCSEEKYFWKITLDPDNRLQVWWINFPTVQFFKIVCLHWPHVAELLTITLASISFCLVQKHLLKNIFWVEAEKKKFKGQAAGENCGHGAPFSRTPVLIISSSSFFVLLLKLLTGATDIFREHIAVEPIKLICVEKWEGYASYISRITYSSVSKMKLPFSCYYISKIICNNFVCCG